MRPSADPISDPAAWLRSQGESFSQTNDGHESTRSICDSIFAEEPVSLETFIADRQWIGMSPLSGPQYEFMRMAERIYMPDLYPIMAAEFDSEYWAAPLDVKNLLTLLVGKGGGKDMICRLASLRISYLTLCLHDPKAYYGMPTSESIHLLNVAATKDQARLAFFEPMTRITDKGWWKDKCHPLKKVIEWDKGVTTLSGSSDAETQEGLNLLLGVADEVDAFRTEAEAVKNSGGSQRAPQRSAEGILKMLRSSALTRFPRTFKNLRISYPRYFGSPILKLHAQARADIEAKGSGSRHYVVGPMPSWDFNPLLRRSRFVDHPNAPVQIPEEWVEDFTADPGWARAAYLCQPERTRLPAYFRSESAVKATLVEMPQIDVHWEFVRGAWQAVFVIPRELEPAPGAAYACHADLAVNKDRCGFAMSHVKSWDRYQSFDMVTGELVRWEELPTLTVDLALALEADLDADPPREIQLRAVRQLVFELRQRGFPIVRCSLDGWQSTDSRQLLEIAGVEAPVYSVDRTEDPYRVFRNCVEESRVELPANPLLAQELLKLSQDPRTRKIDHEPGGSKDIADAVCGSLNNAIDVGGREVDAAGESDGEDFWVAPAVAGEPLGMGGMGTSLVRY